MGNAILGLHVTEGWGEWAGPYACLDLPSVLVDKGLALDHNFSFHVLLWWLGGRAYL